MARGWESKSVESQIESANNDLLSQPDQLELTPAEREIRDRIKSLLLSRAKVQQDLKICRSESYRKLLNLTLADLNKQITELK
jgi:hypothetical protein